MLKMDRILGKGRRISGFTLIELLVVIAIIALLVSILLPSLNKAKELAKSAACMANIKGISTSLFIYTEDYDGWCPQDFYDVGWTNIAWANTLSITEFTPDGAIEGFHVPPKGPYVCPSYPDPELQWGLWSDPYPTAGAYTFGINGGYYWFSTHYALLGFYTMHGRDNVWPTVRISETEQAGGTFMLGDASSFSQGVIYYPGRYMSLGWASLSLRHGDYNKCNMAFADGHVEALNAEEADYDLSYYRASDIPK